ncbi:hypothetical protein DFH09DRAFT_1455585 [Mycena vulgaris]|nr:hypothetical protein DFH09DRAFT_1455585 [Mycena vulgaris]
MRGGCERKMEMGAARVARARDNGWENGGFKRNQYLLKGSGGAVAAGKRRSSRGMRGVEDFKMTDEGNRPIRARGDGLPGVTPREESPCAPERSAEEHARRKLDRTPRDAMNKGLREGVVACDNTIRDSEYARAERLWGDLTRARARGRWRRRNRQRRDVGPRGGCTAWAAERADYEMAQALEKSGRRGRRSARRRGMRNWKELRGNPPTPGAAARRGPRAGKESSSARHMPELKTVHGETRNEICERKLASGTDGTSDGNRKAFGTPTRITESLIGNELA